MEIFEIGPILDDPRFEGFAVLDTPSFLGRTPRQTPTGINDVGSDFFPPLPYDWNWSASVLKRVWDPRKIRPTGRVLPFNDYPCINLLIPAFSTRAVMVLREFLDENGELLPFEFHSQTYYAYNCQTIVDALNYPSSVGSEMQQKSERLKLSLSYYDFYEDKLRGLTIFRERHSITRIFVSDRFVSAVKVSGLNGFDFAKIWPLQKGSDYRQQHRKLIRARMKEGFLNGVPIKSQSMIIELPMQGTKPTSEEKKKIEKLENEIDAQLMVRHLDIGYFGSLEGKRTIQCVTSLFLSCPNAENLFEKLRPWLRSIEWPAKPRILLRHVPYDHTPAEQTEATP